jgi:hypothetical protein
VDQVVEVGHLAVGIGALLLRHAIEQAWQLGAQRLELGTGTFGHQLTFYQRALSDAQMAANLLCFMAALLPERHGLLCQLQWPPAAKMAQALQRLREQTCQA